jgi:aspartate-semialdehyde dehydrogenase
MKLSSARMVVTGATSVTGREILMLLADSGADKSLITAAESGRVKDNQLSFGEDGLLDLISQDEADFTGAHIVLHAGEAREAVGLARKATAAGAVFIDGTGTFALDPDVPLIVPEVNGALLADTPAKNIIASPAPLAVFLSLGLNPLHKQARVTRAVVSTYQSVSAWGREAQDELFSQTKAVFMAQESKSEHLPKQIAFNCYPMVGHR